MNKTELISAIAENTGLTKKDTEAFLKGFQEVIIDAMADGEEVKLTGFLTFSVAETRAREVLANPKQPELGKKTIPAGKKVKVKVGKILKDSVK